MVQILTCEECSSAEGRRFQIFNFGGSCGSPNEREHVLCVKCARQKRNQLKAQKNSLVGISRKEFIEQLNQFFATSGIFDICRRCHEQGTGCCPPTCRVMGRAGCDKGNKYGKTVFCSTFVCGALLNAVAECDPEVARKLKWIKNELGQAEFGIYEMITRVPQNMREGHQPLKLPARYPYINLDNGKEIKEKLDALAEEILIIRARWHENEELKS